MSGRLRYKERTQESRGAVSAALRFKKLPTIRHTSSENMDFLQRCKRGDPSDEDHCAIDALQRRWPQTGRCRTKMINDDAYSWRSARKSAVVFLFFPATNKTLGQKLRLGMTCSVRYLRGMALRMGNCLFSLLRRQRSKSAIAIPFFAGGVGGGADTLVRQLEFVGVRKPNKRFIERDELLR